jgi:hypothetical protein
MNEEAKGFVIRKQTQRRLQLVLVLGTMMA